jgi:hypothetical protein
MVPQHLVAVRQLPRLTNGKVDYKAVGQLQRRLAEVTAPKTETERLVAAIWTDVLKAPEVGRDSDFFDLGGESLAAIMVVTRLREELGIDTRVAVVLRHRRLADLAAALDAIGPQWTDAPNPGREPAERAYSYPASHAQRRLWFVGQFIADPSTYNAPMFLAAPMALDPRLLEKAWARITDAHDALRTTYEERAGEIVAVVHAQSQVEVRHVDLRDDAQAEEALRAMCSDERGRSFDLAQGPVGRVTHFQTAAGSRLFINLHHIATDLWSAAILVRALVDVVENDAEITRPVYSCRGHAEREREAVRSGAWDVARVHLLRELTPPPPVLELPTDMPRPDVQSFRGAEIDVSWSVPLPELAEFARTRALTPFMVLMCAYLIALRRWTNQDDVVVGFPVAGREDDELREVVGFFVSTSFVRVDMGMVSTIDQLVEVVRDKVLAAIEHHLYPFDALVSAAELDRSVDRPPVFSVMLAHQDLTPLTDEMRARGWRLEDPADPVTPVELGLTTWVEDGRLRGTLSYCSDLFTPDSARSFEELVGRCLAQLVQSS